MDLQNTDNPYSFGADTPGGNGSDISGPPVPLIDAAASTAQQSLADHTSCAQYQGWKLSPATRESDPTGD